MKIPKTEVFYIIFAKISVLDYNFRDLVKASKSIDLKDDAKNLRIALLGDHSTQFFNHSTAAAVKISGFNPDIFEADYDQIDLTIFDPTSEFNKVENDYVIIWESSLKLLQKYWGTDIPTRASFAAEQIQNIQNRIDAIKESQPKAKILVFNLEIVDADSFGTYSDKLNHSLKSIIYEINHAIHKMASIQDSVYHLDVNMLGLQAGKIRNNVQYINSDLHYDLDFFAHVSQYIANFIRSQEALFKKCLILDLDNTTWGGVIGDDGMENIQIGSLGIGKAFTNLQKWAKELKNRGIILAVCSKNTESIAKEPFEKHSDMVLRLEDISVFVANWENKADNIRYIQEVLNISFDSMVFLDDNPLEREIVSQEIPEICVPELPEDPVDYLPYLWSLNLFETSSFSKNDSDRTKQYQEEAKRKALGKKSTNVQDYLKSLEMVAQVNSFDETDVPRIAQLTQRSNQFNLRTIRYTEEDIKKIINSDNYLTYSVKLSDKFGSYGLISLVILEKSGDSSFFIDTWIMSCRVLKRDVEKMLINRIVDDLNKLSIERLDGERIPTKKNIIVKDLLKDLSFSELEVGKFELFLSNFTPHKHYINE